MFITINRLFFVIILMIYFFSNCSFKLNGNKAAPKNPLQIDTVQAYFFYEVNVPLMCYSRFDQIEQGNNLIYFDSLINHKEIEELYKGETVFICEYQGMMEEYMEKAKAGITQNKESIQNFQKNIFYLTHQDDTAYTRTLYHDKNRILTYKKIYAKFACANVGKLKQLVPITKNFKCCYSNSLERIQTFFIIDVFEFKLE